MCLFDNEIGEDLKTEVDFIESQDLKNFIFDPIPDDGLKTN